MSVYSAIYVHTIEFLLNPHLWNTDGVPLGADGGLARAGGEGAQQRQGGQQGQQHQQGRVHPGEDINHTSFHFSFLIAVGFETENLN